MHNFHPQEIYLDPTVKDLPVTKRILKKFPKLPVHEVLHRKEIKVPQGHTQAKKQLFLTRLQGQVIKPCQGMGDYVCCDYHTVALVTDCHLECTYCILQDFLQNNPVITIHVNVEEILDQIRQNLEQHPEKTLRFGTGELSDSLALDHITEFSKDLVPFANQHQNAILELKTKSDNIDHLLKLEHKGNTVISWSLNPQKYIQLEEHKCASLTKRLEAARLCADKGYRIGFHLDPVLYFDDWEGQYTDLIEDVADRFSPEEIAWISLGTLRFTPGLKKINEERFPKSRIMSTEMFPIQDGKTRYFRPIREEMYRFLTDLLQKKLQKVPNYLCMETKTVWKNVYGSIPDELEHNLSKSFQV